MGDQRKKKAIIIIATLLFIGGGIFLFFWGSKRVDKQALLVDSLSAFEKVANFLPIKEDSKKEIEAINQVVQSVTKIDDIERRYLFLLQNNMELRPGGGFLGQYAIIKVKNGKITYQFFEDANILDQRITAKVSPPYPFERMMSLKKWKFRDSNFSPDFPTNVEKAKYFYRLSGGNSDFDGVIAVNATVLNKILEITGPVVIGGVQYTSQDAFLKLEEQVEKAYLLNEDLDTQNRKWVMKKMAEIIIDRLVSLNNIPKISSLVLEELRNKDIQLNFQDVKTQQAVEDVHWDGRISTGWEGDYLMIVDANMGALKSDYYIDREVFYEVDLTGERPTAYLKINYTHNATYGDWRTSDYHSYLRIYVPQGSNLTERKMVSYPNIQEEFNKTYFGFILHVLINRSTLVEMRYELPESVRENYRLLIQKQSGVGDVPVHVRVKTSDGEFTQDEVLKKDLRFEFEK